MKYSQKQGRKPDNYIILQIQMAKNKMHRQPDRASLLLWYAPPYQTLPERLSIDTSKTLPKTQRKQGIEL